MWADVMERGHGSQKPYLAGTADAPVRTEREARKILFY